MTHIPLIPSVIIEVKELHMGKTAQAEPEDGGGCQVQPRHDLLLPALGSAPAAGQPGEGGTGPDGHSHGPLGTPPEGGLPPAQSDRAGRLYV